MSVRILGVLLGLWLLAPTASGQLFNRPQQAAPPPVHRPSSREREWANKMFTTTSHDFGTVAKGSTAQFHFQFKNLYEEDVHVRSVSSSCGCTTPKISKQDVKTHETAEIIAEFNTRDFIGQKSATITVTLDKPFDAEVLLHVTGFIRSDVVMTPGSIDLGTVDAGKGTEKKLQISFAGRDDWKIVDAKTTEPFFEVELNETARGAGKVAYDVLIRMTKDAPPGYVKDQLILVTNDARAHELPIEMEGRVAAKITISPERLFIGTVQPGQTVTKNLMVRGKEPFKIVKIECADKSFKIEPSNEAKLVHMIQVVYTAGQEPGRVSRKIGILTDQDEVVQAVTADVLVVKSDAAGRSAGDD